jgi:L,D-transpeptidase catalytic domain
MCVVVTDSGSAATAVKGRGKSTPTTKTPATLKPRSGGVPIKGWEQLRADEWPEPGKAVTARANGKEVEVFRSPGLAEGRLKFAQGRVVEGQVVFLTLAERDGWVRVLVPIRPNGTVGWVRAADVTLSTVAHRVVIELSSRTLTVERGGQVIARESVAVGTGGTPTPDGLFYVKEVVPQANPRGGLGPVALGLSGYSEVLFSFAGGSGVIGLHGTNAPGSIGRSVSHGCIRISNETIVTLAKTLPLGTPVEIVNRVSDRPSSRPRAVGGGAAVAAAADSPVAAVAAVAATTTTVASVATPPSTVDATQPASG